MVVDLSFSRERERKEIETKSPREHLQFSFFLSLFLVTSGIHFLIFIHPLIFFYLLLLILHAFHFYYICQYFSGLMFKSMLWTHTDRSKSRTSTYLFSSIACSFLYYRSLSINHMHSTPLAVFY